MYYCACSRDGKLLGSTAAGAATPGAAAAAAKTPGAGGNVFSQFVKTHFASIKKEMPAGTPHKEIMSRLATQYKQQKTAAETEQVLGVQQQQQQAELGLVDQQQQQQQREEEGQNEASRVNLQEQLDYGNKQQVIESIDLLSDSGSSDVDQDESVQQLNTAAEAEEGLLTFMQKLNLAG